MMLAIADLHTYYGDSHVLQGVTLEAGEAAVTAVLGRNGAGKTTMCRSLIGLTPARRGRVVMNHVDISGLAPHTICRMGISLVPQGRRIFPSLTVDENLSIAAGRRSGPWDVPTVFALFPRLADRRHNYGNQLSGGEQQMLAIARALVGNPALLVMDEPTEGLAPAMVDEVAALIARLKTEGMAVLLVEQNAAFAVKVADRVHVMSKGTIVHSSDPRSFWQDQDLKTQLLGVPRS
jgi:branched-chain amino acid transport system ATP-binding protein